MHCFIDKNGHIWTISLTVGSVRQIRAITGIDLLNIVRLDRDAEPDTTIFDRLRNEPDVLVSVLYAGCKTEADRNGISLYQFEDAFSSDTIEQASEAILDEILDFFPEAKRTTIRRILSARERFAQEYLTNLAEAIEKTFDLWKGLSLKCPDA